MTRESDTCMYTAINIGLSVSNKKLTDVHVFSKTAYILFNLNCLKQFEYYLASGKNEVKYIK